MQVVLPQATKIAIPNIGSMFIGMVKDTSTFTVIGLLEVVRVTQNMNSTTFQPFVLYTAAAGIYVARGVRDRLRLPGIEKSLTTPPTGGIADWITAAGANGGSSWSSKRSKHYLGRTCMTIGRPGHETEGRA